MTEPIIPDEQHLAPNTAYTECTIKAPVNVVWDALVDFANYDTWNTFTYDVNMPHFDVGEEFVFTVNLAKWMQRKQRERIQVIAPQQVLAWSYPHDQNPWLNATRYQVVVPLDETTTRYQTWETFTGLLVPVIRLTVFNMVQRGFEACARDLKRHCENIR